MQYITKCGVKVMTHLNFCRNNGKPAAVTSWGLGDVGGKLRLGGGGNLRFGGGSCPLSTPQMTPLHRDDTPVSEKKINHKKGGKKINKHMNNNEEKMR